jgi:hypothetical protein
MQDMRSQIISWIYILNLTIQAKRERPLFPPVITGEKKEFTSFNLHIEALDNLFAP